VIQTHFKPASTSLPAAVAKPAESLKHHALCPSCRDDSRPRRVADCNDTSWTSPSSVKELLVSDIRPRSRIFHIILIFRRGTTAKPRCLAPGCQELRRSTGGPGAAPAGTPRGKVRRARKPRRAPRARASPVPGRGREPEAEGQCDDSSMAPL